MEIEEPAKPTSTDRAFPGERRNAQRRHLVYYLRAWDSINSQMLGHIVDFNGQGLMLMSEEPIHVGEEYCLEVRLPDPSGGIQPISFKAVCRWSGSNTNKSLFDSGFEVVEKTSGAIHTMQSSTNAYGFGI